MGDLRVMAIHANENGTMKNLTGEFATLNSGINIVELDTNHLDITPAAFRSKILGWSGWGGDQICYFAETIKTFDLGCTSEVILVDLLEGNYYNPSESSVSSVYMGINASAASSLSYITVGTALSNMSRLRQGEYFAISGTSTPYPPIGLQSNTIRRGSGQSQITFTAYNKYIPILFQLSGSQIIIKQAFQLNGKATASEASDSIIVNNNFSGKWILTYTVPKIN